MFSPLAYEKLMSDYRKLEKSLSSREEELMRVTKYSLDSIGVSLRPEGADALDDNLATRSLYS